MHGAQGRIKGEGVKGIQYFYHVRVSEWVSELVSECSIDNQREYSVHSQHNTMTEDTGITGVLRLETSKKNWKPPIPANTGRKENILKTFWAVCRVFLPFKKRFSYVWCLLGGQRCTFLKPTLNKWFDFWFHIIWGPPATFCRLVTV